MAWLFPFFHAAPPGGAPLPARPALHLIPPYEVSPTPAVPASCRVPGRHPRAALSQAD